MKDKLIQLEDGEHSLCIIKANPLIVQTMKWLGKARNLPPLLMSLDVLDKQFADNDIMSEIEVSDLYVVITNCHDAEFSSSHTDPDRVLVLSCCPMTQIYIASKKELIKYSKPVEGEEIEHELISAIRSQMIEKPLQEVVSHNFKQNCFDFVNCVLFNSFSSVVFDNDDKDAYEDQISELYARIVNTNSIVSGEMSDQKSIILTNILHQPYGSPIVTSLVFTNSSVAKTPDTYEQE